MNPNFFKKNLLNITKKLTNIGTFWKKHFFIICKYSFLFGKFKNYMILEESN